MMFKECKNSLFLSMLIVSGDILKLLPLLSNNSNSGNYPVGGLLSKYLRFVTNCT